MSIYDDGRASRESRLREPKSGTWASSSQDFVHLANILYEHSAAYAERIDGNCSIYALAGIPILFSALRCLLIELHTGSMYATALRDPSAIEELATATSEVRFICGHYAVSLELRDRLQLLEQIRHEILHPAHRPSGDVGNTPAYLSRLRDEGLLQSTGKDVDYLWLDQLKSHRLFRWAFLVLREGAELLLLTQNAHPHIVAALLTSYSRHEDIDTGGRLR